MAEIDIVADIYERRTSCDSDKKADQPAPSRLRFIYYEGQHAIYDNNFVTSLSSQNWNFDNPHLSKQDPVPARYYLNGTVHPINGTGKGLIFRQANTQRHHDE